MNINLLEVNQPIGTFYIGVLSANIINTIAKVNQREFDQDGIFSFGGVQRKQSDKRIKEISEYSSDPDATFPTPIIISVYQDAEYELNGLNFTFNENKVIGEIIDGQHRVKGLAKTNQISKFELPVILMFDLTEEEKAYVFSIINSKQTKVPMSLIYDLFGVSEERSPQKTCHEIARLMNSDEASPLYRRLKMLGKKEEHNASLSQGSFIKYLLPLISKNPDKDFRDLKAKKKIEDDPKVPLRYYFVENKDEVIYKVLLNLFSAAKDVFPLEWDDPNRYILSKTTGYGAILRAFPHLLEEGISSNNLTKSFFIEKFKGFKQRLELENMELTSRYFPSNEQQQKKLADLIVGRE
ncbi:DGQHR domain-containing protein [Paenibacillus urinalis]|uniref:DGQHR domain-containing protein n=1 Tax=Paenibacillus urinalis TaxID=521520 RepID=UPI00196105FF